MQDSTGPQPPFSAPVAIEVMLRFDVPPEEAMAFRSSLADVLDLLGSHAGFVTGWIGQNVDEPDVLALASRWERVGDWRRALSNPQVKLLATPVFYRCRMEPTAFEVVRQVEAGAEGATVRSGSTARAADAHLASPGAAAAAQVPPAWQA